MLSTKYHALLLEKKVIYQTLVAMGRPIRIDDTSLLEYKKYTENTVHYVQGLGSTRSEVNSVRSQLGPKSTRSKVNSVRQLNESVVEVFGCIAAMYHCALKHYVIFEINKKHRF